MLSTRTDLLLPKRICFLGIEGTDGSLGEIDPFLKNELKRFLQSILQDITKKNNTWNIRLLVDL